MYNTKNRNEQKAVAGHMFRNRCAFIPTDSIRSTPSFPSLSNLLIVTKIVQKGEFMNSRCCIHNRYAQLGPDLLGRRSIKYAFRSLSLYTYSPDLYFCKLRQFYPIGNYFYKLYRAHLSSDLYFSKLRCYLLIPPLLSLTSGPNAIQRPLHHPTDRTPTGGPANGSDTIQQTADINQILLSDGAR